MYRLSQNRQSAALSRQRKKEFVSGLEKKIQTLTEELQRSQARNDELLAEIWELRRLNEMQARLLLPPHQQGTPTGSSNSLQSTGVNTTPSSPQLNSQQFVPLKPIDSSDDISNPSSSGNTSPSNQINPLSNPSNNNNSNQNTTTTNTNNINKIDTNSTPTELLKVLPISLS